MVDRIKRMKFLLFPSSMAFRLFVVVLLVAVIGLTILYKQTQSWATSFSEQAEMTRIQTATAVIAGQMALPPAPVETEGEGEGKTETGEGDDTAPDPADGLHAMLAAFVRDLGVETASIWRVDPRRMPRVATRSEEPLEGAMQLVSHSEKPGLSGKMNYDPTMAPVLFQGAAMATHTFSRGDGFVVSAYAPIYGPDGETGMLTVEFVPDVHATAMSDQMRSDMTPWLLLALGALFGIAAVPVRLSQGLSELESATQRLADGDFHTEVKRTGVGEVAWLLRELDNIRESFVKQTLMLEKREERLEKSLQSFSPAELARREAIAGMRNDLRVTLKTDGGSASSVLVDLNRSTAVIEVNGDSANKFPIGSRVDLIVRRAEDSKRTTIPSRILEKVNVRQGTQYEVELLAPGLVDRLPEQLRRAVNARCSFRVRPSKRAPVRAEVWRAGAKQPIKAQLVDVSATGMAIMVRAREAEIHQWGPVVGVRVTLPGDTETTDMYCRIQRVLSNAQYPVLGCAFENRGTDYGNAHAKILDYVMARQRDRPTPTQLAQSA